MSFQAYLDTIEDRTGHTPRALLEIAQRKGYADPSVEAAVILDWLQQEYGLDGGHGMALVHVIKKGPDVGTQDVGTTGAHSDAPETLWLDGRATKPLE